VGYIIRTKISSGACHIVQREIQGYTGTCTFHTPVLAHRNLYSLCSNLIILVCYMSLSTVQLLNDYHTRKSGKRWTVECKKN